MTKQLDMSERRFWLLYRQERKKLASFREQLTAAQIVHCARAARKRMEAGT